MGFKYGERSARNLSEAHTKLQAIFNEVIKQYDCSIIEGHRTEKEQNAAYHSGKSKLKFPKSKHNSKPSNAVDAVPFPIDWNDKARFYYFAGLVKATAFQMGYKIRWGGDWDGDNSFKDQSFHDLPHFELLGEEA